MLLKLAALILVPIVMLMGLVASMGFAVVDVRESHGPHIVVPVPLALVHVAASFVPAHQLELDLPPEALDALPAVEKALAALAEAPDGVLVQVDDGDDHVLVAKEGDLLKVRVSGPDERVVVDLPIAAVERILHEAHDGLTAGEVLGALRQVSRTDLVEVRDGGDHVKVWIW